MWSWWPQPALPSPKSLLCQGLSVCLTGVSVSCQECDVPTKRGATLAALPITSLWVCFPLSDPPQVPLGKSHSGSAKPAPPLGCWGLSSSASAEPGAWRPELRGTCFPSFVCHSLHRYLLVCYAREPLSLGTQAGEETGIRAVWCLEAEAVASSWVSLSLALCLGLPTCGMSPECSHVSCVDLKCPAVCGAWGGRSAGCACEGPGLRHHLPGQGEDAGTAL